MNKVKKFKDLNINEGYFSDVEKDKIKDIFIKYGVKYDNAQKLIDMILSETPDNHENIDNLIKSLDEVNILINGMLGIFR